mmetsp:Transcript_9837/g.17382  ORF Transcript_9837/g.17382 Transcript_9837/m.17382 type:complete len:698 (+) Transcript_9837:318-2411(+)
MKIQAFFFAALAGATTQAHKVGIVADDPKPRDLKKNRQQQLRALKPQGEKPPKKDNPGQGKDKDKDNGSDNSFDKPGTGGGGGNEVGEIQLPFDFTTGETTITSTAVDPDSFIIKFSEEGKETGVLNAVKKIIENGKGKVTNEYQVFSGISASLPPGLKKVLERQTGVEYVEQDALVKAVAVNSWGLDRIDQPDLPRDYTYSPKYTGAGVKVCVVDTGLDQSHYNNGDEFLNVASVLRYTDFNTAFDCNGHGTHCAGTVLSQSWGVGKGAELHSVKVLGCDGSGSNSGVIAAIDYCAQSLGVNIISMSLGGGASQSVDAAVNAATALGVAVVVAAGNDNDNACLYSPARATTAITVGSTTSSDYRSSFSNYGSCVDIFAPGSAITSAWLNGGSASISGTSMATPHVAGALALSFEKVGCTARTVACRDAAVNDMMSRVVNNKVQNAGTGSPNKLLQVETAASGCSSNTECTPSNPNCFTAECQNGECVDVSNNLCCFADSECSTNAACMDAVCENNQCVDVARTDCCTVDSDCTASDSTCFVGKCGVGNTCYEEPTNDSSCCYQDSDCSASTCNTATCVSNTCVESPIQCTQPSDTCFSSSCVNDQCVESRNGSCECINDSECPSSGNSCVDDVCRNNVCVTEDNGSCATPQCCPAQGNYPYCNEACCDLHGDKYSVYGWLRYSRSYGYYCSCYLCS